MIAAVCAEYCLTSILAEVVNDYEVTPALGCAGAGFFIGIGVRSRDKIGRVWSCINGDGPLARGHLHL